MAREMVCLYLMITECMYCDKGRPKFMAQHTIKHAKSHGMCSFHQKYYLRKFELEMSRIHVDMAKIEAEKKVENNR